jgi:hypothetical protein
MNPALLVAQALAQSDLDVRVIEGLPWLLTAFFSLDWNWLVSQCRLLNLQNKLGFLVELAAQLGKSPADQKLREVLSTLEASRLAAEGTLCDDSMNAVERAWTVRHRPPLAARWNLLTTLAMEDLNHAA